MMSTTQPFGAAQGREPVERQMRVFQQPDRARRIKNRGDMFSSFEQIESWQKARELTRGVVRPFKRQLFFAPFLWRQRKGAPKKAAPGGSHPD